jgi:NAD(P)H-dependent nitrite reductase small subunit
VQVEGREIALFRVGDGFRAVDDSCPHAGGPLSAGLLDGQGCVECPWHGWSFDLDSGACRTAPTRRLRTYPVREHDGRVEILVEDPPGS